MPLSPSTRLGPYEVLEPLGAGGMGEVYRARDTRLARDVAIKVLPEAFAADAERLSRFRREAQALASLNHPNIAAIYGLEEMGGSPYLVLELVDGETLAARLERGAVSVRETLAIGVQIAAALEAAHARDIVHRDLKPGNVMITAANVAKVLDFGLATSDAAWTAEMGGSQTPSAAPTRATIAGSLIGTLAYMSPEQARGKPVDRRSDVWSFGCVLFECLSGQPAFAGETPSDLVAGILEREPDWPSLPPDVAARVREVVRRCLRKDAAARPRDIRDVRLELVEATSGTAKEGAAREQSVAVLPFDNLSATDDEYFADGITDEILNRLSQLEGLRVAARTSCYAFKGRREDLRVIGERLDVTSVLEGSVRRAGSRLRITAQLVNAADGYQLWSERYDREMTDVFEVQDEIANAIAMRLRGALSEAADRVRARRNTSNLEAFELLLRGRALQAKRGRFLDEAIACFEKAIALDPQYAEAMAWLSDSYRLIGTFGLEPYAEVMPKAKALAERALAIDNTLTEAWGTLAAVAEQYEWDRAASRTLWARALEIEPRNSRVRSQRAFWGFCTGEYTADEALAEMSRAVQDDPLNPWVGAMRSQVLGFAGRHPESLAEAERSHAIDPESFFPHWNLMRAHAWIGQLDRALEIGTALLRVSGRHPWVLGALAWTCEKAGRVDRARAICDEMEARSRLEAVSPFWLGVVAASAGHLDQAIQRIGRAVDEHDPLIFWKRDIPFWEVIRTDPRAGDVMRKIWG